MAIGSSAQPRRVGAAWFVLFTLVWTALWTAQLTPIQLLIPLQLDTPDDANGWVAGVLSSGVVLGVGGLVALAAGPAAGALSDRFPTRIGRRRPWAIGGSLLAGLSLGFLATASGPWPVGIAWTGFSIGFAVASAAFTALIADQLDTQRGAASASVSSAQAGGLVLGVSTVVLLGLGVGSGYSLLALFVGVVGTIGAILLPDPPGAAVVESRPRARRARDRDFGWLLASRLVVNIGNALGTTLLLFFLLYGLGEERAAAEDDLLLLIIVYTVFVVVASVLGGAVSDRTGRRKSLVIVAAIVQGAAALILVLAPTFGTALVAAALIGTGYGVFSTVGLAYATDLLPTVADTGRDLGLVNVAANLGQLLGPILGAALVWFVGGFWLLFAIAAVLSVVGAVMTAPIGRSSPRASTGSAGGPVPRA